MEAGHPFLMNTTEESSDECRKWWIANKQLDVAPNGMLPFGIRTSRPEHTNPRAIQYKIRFNEEQPLPTVRACQLEADQEIVGCGGNAPFPYLVVGEPQSHPKRDKKEKDRGPKIEGSWDPPDAPEPRVDWADNASPNPWVSLLLAIQWWRYLVANRENPLSNRREDVRSYAYQICLFIRNLGKDKVQPPEVRVCATGFGRTNCSSLNYVWHPSWKDWMKGKLMKRKLKGLHTRSPVELPHD